MNCCQAWEAAQQSGTGNEMYGHLLYQIGEQWQIGTNVPPVQFCPWCGADKRGPDPIVTAARAVVDKRYSQSGREEVNDSIAELASVLEKCGR